MSQFNVNVLLFGIGNIGSTLITHLQKAREFHLKNHRIQLNIPVIANSTLAFYQKEGITDEWEADFQKSSFPYQVEDIIAFVQNGNDDPVIVVDATASDTFIQHYTAFFEAGFHVVAANKKANTQSQEFYETIRDIARKNQVYFRYETNVGASLPVIQTLKDLYLAHEKITKIRGVFSGSLSYIFNRFGSEDLPFSKLVQEAERLGFTEPDSREDLSGNDVARKLLIVAREIGLKLSIEEIYTQSLFVPEIDTIMSLTTYKSLQKYLDQPYEIAKKSQKANHVLRYIGELEVVTHNLQVKLISVPKDSSLGQLQNSDNFFEIYTESNGNYPIIIQGAGAGNEVTARGVMSDILKIGHSLKLNKSRSNLSHYNSPSKIKL